MSSTKPTLDLTVLESKMWTNHTKAIANTDFGVEVELEGMVLNIFEVITSPVYWVSKHDGSLKNGFEYVMSGPQPIESLDQVMAEFSTAMKKMDPHTSIRTSVHVHINVLKQTLRQVYQSAFFWYLIEELVLRTQPKERLGNLFCLRMSDASTIPYFLERSLAKSQFAAFNNEDHFKYSALNLVTVNRLGTLEFRVFQATWKKSELMKYVMLCHDIVRNGAKYGLRELLDMYDAMPVKKFLQKMLPGHEWIYGEYSSEYINQLLQTNYDRLRDLVVPFERPETIVMPKILWVDDTDTGETMAQLVSLKNNGIDPDTIDEVSEEGPDDFGPDPWAPPPPLDTDSFAFDAADEPD